MKHLGYAGRIRQFLLYAQLLYESARGWLLVGALALVMSFGLTTLRACDDAAAGALALSNEKAAHDDTRVTLLTERAKRRIFGDSIQALERLVVQMKPRRDALDRATDRTSAVRAELTLPMPSVTADLSAPVQLASLDVRTAKFELRQPPYTVTAEASLPPAPGNGKLELTIVVDTAHVGVRVQCGKRAHGIRPATVLITPPVWLPAELGKLEADPVVCGNDKSGITARHVVVTALISALFGVLLGQ